MRRFAAVVQQIGQRLVAGGLGVAIPVSFALDRFAGFEDQMAAVRAITKSNTADFMELNDQAKLLGRTTSFTAAQVASAQKELARGGFKPDAILASTAAVLDLARATETELPDAANIAAAALNGFQLTADQMPRVADVMTAAANNSAQTLTDLSEALKSVAPVASQMGQSIEQTAAAIGVLANNGIRGTLAGNALKRAYLNIADPKIRKQLEELTGAQIDPDNFNMAEIISQVGRATEAMSRLDRLDVFSSIFGDRAVVAASALATGKANFDSLAEAMENAEGTANDVATAMDDTLGGSFRMVASAIEGIQIALGETLGAAVRGVADEVIKVAGVVTEWIGNNKGLVVSLAAATAAAIAIGGSLMGLGVAASVAASGLGGMAKIVSVVAKSTGAAAGVIRTSLAAVAAGSRVAIGGLFATVQTVAGAILALNPVTIFAGLAAGVAFLALEATGGLDVIRNGLSSLAGDAGSTWGSIKASASTAWRGVQQTATQAYGGIVALVQRGDIRGAFQVGLAAVKLMWAQTLDAFSAQWAPWVSFITEGWKAATSLIGDAWDATVSFLGSTFGGFGEWFTSDNGAGGMAVTFSDVVASLAAMFARFTTSVENGWLETTDFFADAMAVAVSAITNAWHNGIAFIERAWTRLKGLVSDDVDVDAEITKINKERDEKIKAGNDARDEAIVKRDAERRNARKANEEALAGTLAEIDAERKRKAEAELADREKLQSQARERRESAQAEFDALLQEKAVEGPATEAVRVLDSEGNEIKSIDELFPANDRPETRFERRRRVLQERIESTRDNFLLASANAGSAGTFSSRAAGQIGASSVASQTLDEVKKVAANTKQTVDKIDGLMMEAE